MKKEEESCVTTNRSLIVHFYSDSQGCAVYKGLLNNKLNFIGSVKSGVKFKDISLSIDLEPCDVTVFLAGTIDVARNERRDLLLELKRELIALHSSRNAMVFSVSHRHELPNRLIINKKVIKRQMRKCYHYENSTKM